MFKNELIFLTNAVQMAFMAILGLFAFTAAVATGLSLAGILPFVDIPASINGVTAPWAGMAVQVGVTAFLVLVAGILPAAWRVMRLETSHRRFEMDMDDVTRAYRAAHMADRAEMFGMQREFDAVRERYKFLRSRPDLAEIDAELLTMAAQMSAQSRELAETFSDANLARARDGLEQRKRDVEKLKARLDSLRTEVARIKAMDAQVTSEESTLSEELRKLEAQLGGAVQKPANAVSDVLHFKPMMRV